MPLDWVDHSGVAWRRSFAIGRSKPIKKKVVTSTAEKQKLSSSLELNEGLGIKYRSPFTVGSGHCWLGDVCSGNTLGSLPADCPQGFLIKS